MKHASSSLVAFALLFAACDPMPPPPGPPATPTTPESAKPLPTPVNPTAASFENPGGMWLPEQIPEQASTLRSLGLELDPVKLGDFSAHPLGAIVSLGGCSASFVSSDGLVITNHHCSLGALQNN